MAHRYSLPTIIGWLLFGLIQWIKHVVPDWIIRPETVSRGPPGWWHYYSSWPRWRYCVASDGTPQDCWFDHYFDAVWGAIGYWMVEVGRHYYGRAQVYTRSITGWVQYGYPSLARWLNAIRHRVGTWVPAFTTSLAWGLYTLWRWFPSGIRRATQTWDDLWEGIRSSIRAWVRSIYDWAKGRALAAWEWVIGTGQVLGLWWNAAHRWLDDFRQNASVRVRAYLGSAWRWLVGFYEDPYATITNVLGPSWRRLVAFAEAAVVFYYNLWSEHWSEIGEFWQDPLGWLYDRVEEELCRRW